MKAPTTRERQALQNAKLGGKWEYKAKLGGEKTFKSLLENGWIEPYAGHNPNGDCYSITPQGEEAYNLPNAPKKRSAPNLKTLGSRLGEQRRRFK